MGKSLKYVTEFEFPADKGYTGSCAKEPAKAYAKGGACCHGGKAMKAKGGPIVERATGEKYPSREAMVRHESLETPRMQREEVVKRQVVKAPQNRRRGEPMIKPKERGETLLAQRQQQAAPLNAIAQANIPGVAMKKGGKCYADGGKVKKMALGGSSSIRPGERQGSSPVAQARPPAPAARPAPQKQPVAPVAPVARPVARPAPQKQPVASQSQLRSAVQNPQQKGIQGGLQAGMKVPTQSPMQASMSGQAPSGNMQGGIQGNMQVGRPTSSDIPQGGQMGYRANNQATGNAQTPPQVNSPAMVQSRMYPGPMGVQNGMSNPQLGQAPMYKKGGTIDSSKKK